jgi:hypothetical protein
LITAKSKLTKKYEEFAVETEKDRRSVVYLFNAIKTLNTGSEQRRKLIGEINSKYAEYLPKLLTEKSSLQEINTAQNLVIQGLRQKIALQMRDELVGETTTKRITEQSNALERLRKRFSSQMGSENADQLIKNIKIYYDTYGKDTEKANNLVKVLSKNSFDMLEYYFSLPDRFAVAVEEEQNREMSLINNMVILTNRYKQEALNKEINTKLDEIIKGLENKMGS